MMEEDFYATLKLKTGEEIFAKVLPTEEESGILLLINNPIIISQVKNRSGVSGYKVEPWLKTSNDDLFVININDVLTMSESNDVQMIMMHQSYVRHLGSLKTGKPIISRKMGYIANVNDAKEILEKIYRDS